MIKKKIQQRFEENFEEEVREILILTDDSSVGAVGMGDQVWQPVRDILAYVDLKTGEVVEGKGRVEWLAEDRDKGNWIHDLKNESIYQLQVRKIRSRKIPEGMLPWLNNTFMLVNVVKRDASHPALEEILEAYRRPVYLEDEQCGIFELERQFGWFTNTIDWLGEECQVFLECDEDGGVTAVQAQKIFHTIYDDLEAWDKKFREYAAGKLTGLANDWLQEEEGQEGKVITEKDFASRIWISEITVRPSGDYDAYYYDDDMFWGHIIIISGNVDTGMEDADIAG